jgi:hypothetical protein
MVPLLFSLVESPFHPSLGHLYQQLGITGEMFGTARKLHKALQLQKPGSDRAPRTAGPEFGVSPDRLDCF